MAVRHRRQQPQPAGGPAIAERHVGAGPGLVDEDEAIGVERGLPPDELAPRFGDIGAVLLGGVQALFLSVSLCALTNRHTVLSPTVTPHDAASASRISAKVRSGCLATSSSAMAR